LKADGYEACEVIAAISNDRSWWWRAFLRDHSSGKFFACQKAMIDVHLNINLSL